MTDPPPRWTQRLGQLASRHGSLLVLLLLCAYYSVATWSEQQPMTPAAGAALGRGTARYLQQAGRPLTGVIVIRSYPQDAAFGDSVSAAFTAAGGTIVRTIVADQPIDVVDQLQALSVETETIPVLLTHHTLSTWGPLQADRLQSLGDEIACLKGCVVLRPKSYHWPSFLTRANLLNVVNQNADVAILAIGMTLVIITGGIDLSVGSVLALAGVLMAITINGLGGGAAAPLWIWLPLVLLAIAACGAVGGLNGLLSTYGGIPAFIVTLATMMIIRGLALIIAVRYQSYGSDGAIDALPEAIAITSPGFSWLGNGKLLGIPNPIWLMLALFVLTHVMMTRTPLGRYIYAVGGNPQAAHLSGVPVKKVLILVYVLCGISAAIGGFIDASRFEGGRPGAGDTYELQVIAAVVVGGTSLAGGEGRIMGTLIGALIIAVIQNGLNIAGVQAYEQKVIFGSLILAASFLDQLKKRWN
ncbi:MAG: ABC transporter permease [Planctomycetaceae bacterium]|nr:ABC transporter permease [Planctomycetaceae bacterium]